MSNNIPETKKKYNYVVAAAASTTAVQKSLHQIVAVCSNKPKKDGNNFPRSIETRKWFEDKNVVTYSKWKLCNSLQFKWGTAHQQQTGGTADVEIRGRSMIDSSSSFAFFFIFLSFSTLAFLNYFTILFHLLMLLNRRVVQSFWISRALMIDCAPNRKRDAADLHAEKKEEKEKKPS